jgi:2,5-diamino-6-(ribosylamino)-4(3H)-pyrimidinone 5'-phosphate reductase
MVLGPFRLRIDLERCEWEPFLAKDGDDIGRGARHRGREDPLHRTRPSAGLRIARVEEDLLSSVHLCPKEHLTVMDQMSLHGHRLAPRAPPDMKFAASRNLVIRPGLERIVRPHVIINAAMSIDGKIALAEGKPARISNEEDLRRVHRLRAEVDAILVGIGTVLADDPKLTVKPEFARGSHPLRIVVDSDGRTPPEAHVLDGASPTLIVTSEATDRTFSNAEVLRAGKDDVDLEALLEKLAKRGVKTLLVEGGSAIIWSFLRKRLADELKVFIGSRVLGGSAPSLAGGQGSSSLDDAPRLRLQKLARLGDGVLLEYAVMR